MKSIDEYGLRPRQALGRLPAYNAGISAAVARRVSGKDDVICLGSNENPYGTSPAVGAALWGLIPSRYSDPTSTALREALSEKLSVATDRIVCGNGSEELIAAICRAYLEPGDHILTVSPCFGLHEIEPLAAGAQVTKVPMTDDLDFDIDALVAALVENPKIFFISSPSNPVGQAMSEEAMSRFEPPPGPALGRPTYFLESLWIGRFESWLRCHCKRRPRARHPRNANTFQRQCRSTIGSGGGTE